VAEFTHVLRIQSGRQTSSISSHKDVISNWERKVRLKMLNPSQVWWCTPGIPALKRLRILHRENLSQISKQTNEPCSALGSDLSGLSLVLLMAVAHACQGCLGSINAKEERWIK
jgi:hypothetical protein